MEPVQVRWRVIAFGPSDAVEQQTILARYAMAESRPKEGEEPQEPAEFNIIASSPGGARTVAAALLRLLRQDSRCSVVKPQTDGQLEKE